MGVESTCGALTGGIMALSSKIVNESEKTSNIKNLVINFLNKYENNMGSILCKDLKAKHYNEDIKCSAIILEAAKALDKEFSKLK